MQPANVGRRLRDFLRLHGSQYGTGISEEHIQRFEDLHKVLLPVDLRDYFVEVNGSAEDYAYGIIRFWSLNQMKCVTQVVAETPPGAAVIQSHYRAGFDRAEQYYVFADLMHDMQLYAIWLSSSQTLCNEVILLDGTAPTKVADSFSDFVELYFRSPERLRLCVD